MNWKSIFGRRRDDEINEEIEAHLRMAIQDRVERGESPEEARYGAVRELGNAMSVKEAIRDVWISRVLQELLQDLRFAGRVLTKSPGFSVAAIALIALGIGGNATIYSMINAVSHKPMPSIHADNLISLGRIKDGQQNDPGNSYPNYLDYAQSKTLRPMLARGWERFTVTLDKASYGVWGTLVTTNYFDTLGIRLVKGRPFTEAEGRLDASGLVAVISHNFWQDAFQGTDDIAGRKVTLNGHPATVIGVAPERFHGPQLGERDDVWVPLLSYARIHHIEPALNARALRDSIGVELIARLAPGASLSQARAELDTISQRLQAAYPKTNKGMSVLLVPYSALGPGIQPVHLFVNIMLAVAILTLLVVCANVANLMLSRAALRQREIAVRESLGAPRSRIFRMLLAEGLTLSLAALVAAWLFARWASQGLQHMVAQDGGRVLDVDFTPDWRVAGYAIGLAVFSTLAFTAAPAIRAWRQDPLPWLKAGQQCVLAGRSRLSSVLVVTQLALCVVLITGAGLAYRSQYLINNLEFHYQTDHLALVTVGTSGSATTPEQHVALLERLRERLCAVPGVLSASYAREAPLRGGLPVGPAKSAASFEPIPVEGNYVGPDYLPALGVVPLQGRGILESDRRDTKTVAMINQNLSRALWPGQPAIGQTLTLEGAKQIAEVVGVLPNGAFASVRQTDYPNFLYLAERQNPADPGETTLHVRYAGTLDRIAPAIRAAIRETDARVPVFELRGMESLIRNQTGPVLMIATLLSVFAGGSLILAAIGLYAVIAFNMSRRTRDFGIRIALGASQRQIVEAVLKEGLLITAIGLAVGFALNVAGAKALGSLLYGITATDWPTYLGVLALLSVVSLVACYLPARRAARIDPMQALRQE
jgi:macrolide transport system ATP-binding/permease protein